MAALFDFRWSKWPRHQLRHDDEGQVNLHSVLEDGSHAVHQVLLRSLCVGSQSSQAWNGQEQSVATCGPRDHGSGVVSVVRTPRLGNTISATKEDAGSSRR